MSTAWHWPRQTDRPVTPCPAEAFGEPDAARALAMAAEVLRVVGSLLR